MPEVDHASVIVWQTALDSSGDQTARYRSVLSAHERERADRFRQDRQRQRFVTAHGQLRLILSQYLEQPPELIAIAQNAQGKPYIADHRLQFNLAHVNDVMLCALTWDYAVGIDVEDTRREVEMMTIARSFFSPGEVELLEVRTPNDQRQLFFDLWTRKEAYLKARGVGLTFNALDTPISVNSPLFSAADGTRWSVLSFSPAPDLRAAVVTAAATLSMQLSIFRE